MECKRKSLDPISAFSIILCVSCIRNSENNTRPEYSSRLNSEEDRTKRLTRDKREVTVNNDPTNPPILMY